MTAGADRATGRASDPHDGLQPELVAATVVLLLAVVVPVLVQGSPLVSVLAAAAALVAAVALMLRLRDDAGWSRDGWRQIEQLMPELVGQGDQAAILRVVLADAPGLLRCERVEAVLHPTPDGPALWASQLEGSDAVVEVARLDAVADGAAEDVVAQDPRAVVVVLGASGRPTGVLVASGGARSGRRTRRQLAAGLAHVVSSAMLAEQTFASDRRLADHTRDLAWRDELTGLGNRSLLNREASRHLAVSVVRQRKAVLLMVDLDDFKRVNDTLGHGAGDRVLGEVGRRIRDQVRDTDVAVRLGGDEFAILAGQLASADDAVALAERLLAALERPVRVDDVELRVRGSVGLAVHGEDGDSLDALLQAADQAMYEAKADGLGRWRRASAVDAGTPARRDLVHDLRLGIPDEQLVLHYQPQVAAAGGQVVGFEATALWSHPEHGLLPAEDFLPEAERQGQTRELTCAVLARALEDLVALRVGAPSATVALNLSARHLLGRGLVADLSRALTLAGLAPADLVLEVAEPAGASSPTVTAVLDAVAELGCVVSVHRFGSALSSLTAISRHAAIREVKVDPGLGSTVLEDPATERLVRGMVTAAHGLGLRVVAEGVQSDALRTALTDLGCDRLQGDAVHAAAPVAEVAEWLAPRRSVAPGAGR